MAMIVSHYVCSSCGRAEEKPHEICPECGAHNSFEKCLFSDGNYRQSIRAKRSFPSGNVVSVDVKPLSSIRAEENTRFSTHMFEFDRVLGGGAMKGSSILIGGEPGIGKSTLLLSSLSYISEEHNAVYISGEETDVQVRLRADRLKLNTDKIKLFSSTSLSSIVDMLWRERPQVIVVDSLQTLSTSDIDSPSGTQSQIKACTHALCETVKILGITMFLIAHINKDGSIAGPKYAEHLVDTVLYFESAEGMLRIVRASKNRYGSSDEIGVFVMGENGLTCVEDPSRAFAVERTGDTPAGIVNTVVIVGTRAVVVELQVLCVPSKTQNRRIFSDKIDVSVVQRVVAILETCTELNLTFNDIYVNVAGGMRITDPNVELALAVAVYTSFTSSCLKSRAVFYGELTLLGEVRKAMFERKRSRSALSMGFERIACALGEDAEQDRDEMYINITDLKDIKTVIEKLGSNISKEG
ncbi:MAG: ATPase domain-containing protein [Sphaerochaetaceae bacterium]|nr:ATPase domain-containing protein [Sphaerochaetaceae bacterium]